jgi:hypothetical protein
MKQMVIFTDCEGTSSAFRLKWVVALIKGGYKKEEAEQVFKISKNLWLKRTCFCTLENTCYYWVEQTEKKQKFLRHIELTAVLRILEQE